MTNQEFCYWLQGYFEISRESSLNERKVLLIASQLEKITEPLGIFTGWLQEVILYFEKLNYQTETLRCFTDLIKSNLNSIFFHVIDNSYTDGPAPAEWQLIHDGVLQT